MSCKNCGNILLTLTAKCYDNFSLSYADPRLNTYNNLGFSYDGKNVELSYCLHCGKVDGDFPVVLKDLESLIVPSVTIGQMIQKFYDCVMVEDAEAHSIMKKLNVRMSPTDFNDLLELWANYESIKKVNPYYMEFDECVKSFVKRYDKYPF